MPTPVGPAAPDPDDPDLWEEWYDEDEDEDDIVSGFGWPVRIIALVVVVGFVLLVILVG